MKILTVFLSLLVAMSSAIASDQPTRDGWKIAGDYYDGAAVPVALGTFAVLGEGLYTGVTSIELAGIATTDGKIAAGAGVAAGSMVGVATAISSSTAAGFVVGSMIVYTDRVFLKGSLVDATGKLLTPVFWGVYQLQKRIEKQSN